MKRDSWGVQSIMVWGAIGISHEAGPVIFKNIVPGRGNGVTALRYINQVLRLHIVRYFGRHQHHMFLQDSVCAHTAEATRDFLQQHNIRIMSWPTLSLDLNPTEHLWDKILTKLNEVRSRPITAVYISVAFLRIWAAIPMAFINCLIHSKNRR